MAQQVDFATRYAKTSGWQRERGQELMAMAAPRQGESVLDIGCGTGGLTAQLARRVGAAGKVVGVDPDAARVALARSALPADLHNLQFVEGRGESMPWITGGSVDLAFSNFVLHWVPNKPAVVRETMRCLRPGGRLAFQVGGNYPDVLAEATDAAASGEDRRIASLAFLSAEEWGALLRREGFVSVRTRAVDSAVSFASAEAFYDWWEGTSHGAFRRQAVRPQRRDTFEASFAQGRIATFRNVQIVAAKPH